jgi:uncharacterized protein
MAQKPVMLITGASSGIGEAVARLFGREGFCVVLAARRFERLETLAHEIVQHGGEALPVAADLNQLHDIQNLVHSTYDRFGHIDILVNNAGFGRLKWLEDLDPVKDIEMQIRVNLLAVLQLTNAVLPQMIERRSGHIINMVSMAGFIATPTYSVYAATKFALRGFTESLRREVGVFGIHVTGIYPGSVETEFNEHTGSKRRTGISMPASLRLKSDDVAGAVLSVTQRPRRTVILPWFMRMAAWGNFLFPWLVDFIIEQRFVRRERRSK